jgi:hypothetical protein
VRGVAIYVEGGGDTAQQRADLRRGLDALLEEAKGLTLAQGRSWRLVPCGTRRFAYEAFLHASRGEAKDSLNLLLVDAEEALSDVLLKGGQEVGHGIAHLMQREGWEFSGIAPERVHLMVQCMEAWILADPEALGRYYGQGFLTNVLPRHADLEQVPKAALLEAIKRATERTTKGKYGKIRHASPLLERIDPAKVADRCPHFASLQQWLRKGLLN